MYNLCSERCYPSNHFHNRVALFGFDDHNVPVRLKRPLLIHRSTARFKRGAGNLSARSTASFLFLFFGVGRAGSAAAQTANRTEGRKTAVRQAGRQRRQRRLTKGSHRDGNQINIQPGCLFELCAKADLEFRLTSSRLLPRNKLESHQPRCFVLLTWRSGGWVG